MNLTTIGPVGQIALHPLVSCVDIDGRRLHESERDIPHVEPDPTDPHDWPAWTDNWLWETTEPDAEDAAYLAAFDRVMAAMESAEGVLEDVAGKLRAAAGDNDLMAFPVARPAHPLPDRLSPEGLYSVGRALAAFDLARTW